MAKLHLLQAGAERRQRVWAEYPLVAEHLTHPGFEVTDDRAAADIIMSSRPIRDFLCLPR